MFFLLPILKKRCYRNKPKLLKEQGRLPPLTEPQMSFSFSTFSADSLQELFLIFVPVPSRQDDN